MKVSVIVPIYNKARYLERCVQSILAQSLSDFELILVDDGSTDESREIAGAFADHRIRILHQENKGPGSARNLGIAAAHGSVCAFLDADDAWIPTYLEESVKLLESNTSVAAVVSGYFEFPGGCSTEEYWRKRGISEGIVSLHPSHPPTLLVALLAYMSSWSTVACTDVLLKWGGFYDQNRCTYAEDSFLWLKVLLNEKVFFSTKPRAHFHREASELSNTRSGPRPVEPFLTHPELIREVCPQKLSHLLEDFLAIRAFKTSCMLGYWGEWRRAQRLFLNFARVRHWRLPLLIPAVALTNPVGAAFAGTVRRVTR
jgi:glycosyltransferase involved in cell wall biosynthesis